jgi:hypothetical protein
LVSFSGVFTLRDGVSEKEFLPRLHAFLQYFIDVGFATDYRIMRREALADFGRTLPAFAYRGELIYPDWSGSMPRTNTSNNAASGYTRYM